MANAKISAASTVTVAEDLDIIPIVVEGAPKLTRKILVGSLRGRAHGEVYVNGGAAAQGPLVADTWTKLTAFDTNGVSLNTTPAHATDKITNDVLGRFLVIAHLSFSMDAIARMDFAAYWNASITHVRGTIDAVVADDEYQVSISGLVFASVLTKDFELWMRADDTDTITVTEAALSVLKV